MNFDLSLFHDAFLMIIVILIVVAFWIWLIRLFRYLKNQSKTKYQEESELRKAQTDYYKAQLERFNHEDKGT